MKKADFIIIGVVLAVAAVLVIILYGLNGKSGDMVQLEVDGSVVEQLSLDEDIVRRIDTADGGENTLVIKDGKAYMESANCPDGICVNHMPIRRVGESVICLPHKVVITIVNSDTDDSEIDAVA